MFNPRFEHFKHIDFSRVPSPCYVIHMGLLEQNCRILHRVQEQTGAKVLLALKGFAAFSTFPLIFKYLSGTTASGLHEALLGYELFGGETHTYCPAYKPEEIEHLCRFTHTLTFNSINQWRKFRPVIQKSGRRIECGLRLNPEYSEVETELYNPCAVGSRLGIRASQIEASDLDGITGLHFHTMCEQNSDTLERTVEVVEEKFSKYFDRIQWINFGGGHHVTRDDYDVDRLCRVIERIRDKYNLQVYIEPGEAIGLATGVLVTTVLDLIENGMPIALLDTSVTAHMPDVLEMPYRPDILGGGDPQEKAHTYRLGGMTCLAGDVIGDWSFAQPLKEGDRIIFGDMAHYTMVKNTTFNGVPLPSIALYHPESDSIEVVRQFSYSDYRNRLS